MIKKSAKLDIIDHQFSYPELETKPYDEESTEYENQTAEINTEYGFQNQVPEILTSQNGTESNHFDGFNSELSKTCSNMGFIRKVLGILSAQLILTILINFVILTDPRLVQLSKSISGFALTLGIISIILIMCSDYFARKVPVNYIVLGVATVCESISISAFLS